MPNCCVVGFGAYGEIKEMWSRSTEVQCTQIKPSTIWSESFDPCAICEEAGDDNDDDDGDGDDDIYIMVKCLYVCQQKSLYPSKPPLGKATLVDIP